MVNKWSPGCNCACDECPECTEYGSTVYYTFSEMVHGGWHGYANANKPATDPGTSIRWSYWTGDTDLFNASGSFVLPPLQGTVPNRSSLLIGLPHSVKTISVWISEQVPWANPKPAISSFYEYEVTLTFVHLQRIFDDCGTRDYDVVVGTQSGTVSAISPFDPSVPVAQFVVQSPVGDWIGGLSFGSPPINCNYISGGGSGPGIFDLRLNLNPGLVITQFGPLPLFGKCTLSLTP